MNALCIVHIACCLFGLWCNFALCHNSQALPRVNGTWHIPLDGTVVTLESTQEVTLNAQAAEENTHAINFCIG